MQNKFKYFLFSTLRFFIRQEFEIILVKQQGSLGFTLRKEDESVLGHYVRALVREPATTDGRIKPGDKIVAVGSTPCFFFVPAILILKLSALTVKHAASEYRIIQSVLLFFFKFI